MFAKKHECRPGDLGVDVPIPWKHLCETWVLAHVRCGAEGSYLSIPPPTQQGAMCQPSLYVVLLEKVQVCPHHVHLRILLLFIAQNAVLVSAIIMVWEGGATGFMEVFGPSIGRRLWGLLFPPSGKQCGIGLARWWVYKEGIDEKIRGKGEGKKYWAYPHDGVLCEVEEYGKYVQRAIAPHLSPKGGCCEEFQWCWQSGNLVLDWRVMC